MKEKQKPKTISRIHGNFMTQNFKYQQKRRIDIQNRLQYVQHSFQQSQ